MDNGEVVLLKNIRAYDFETKKDLIYGNPFVNTYSKIFDYYIIDAFSVAHREQSSIVGFKDKLINIAGPVFEKEFNEVQKLKENGKKPIIYVLGGEKVDDLIDLVIFACENNKVDKILTTGFLSVLALEAFGIKTKDERVLSYLDIIKELKKFGIKIEIPIDVAINFHGRRREVNVIELNKYKNTKILDIGKKTIDFYSKLIKEARTIYAKGPAGFFEDEKFAKGTFGVLKAIKENKRAYKFLGGGHIVTAFKEFFKEEKLNNGYISLSGGAVVKYLANKPLPALEVLKESYKRFLLEKAKK
jgi:phosphoglycerate kinase